MELSTLTDLLKDPDKLVKAIQIQYISPLSHHQASCAMRYSPQELVKAYEPVHHRVNNAAYRQDKHINVDSGEETKDGEPKKEFKTEFVTRIAIPLQKLIVKTCATFLTGGGCDLKAMPVDKEIDLFGKLKSLWATQARLNVRNNEIAQFVLSECQVAELWFAKKDAQSKLSLKTRLYAPSLGYTLMPVFDKDYDLIAFAIEGTMKDSEGKDLKYIYLYTDTVFAEYWLVNGTWKEQDKREHKFGKIPVIYAAQDRPVWADVQSAIDRFETVLSNFCDTNDYFAAPVLAIIGEVMGLASKGDTGKTVQLENQADAKYITWNQMPEAIKFEIETLMFTIETCTQTPIFNFQSLMKLGDITGPAFDRMMIPAHLKAKEQHDGWYGEYIQRRLNFLVQALAATQGLSDAAGLEVTPSFRMFRIDDLKERIQNALLANGNKAFMSVKESIEFVGVSSDTEATFENVTADAEREATLQIKIAGHAQDTSANTPDPNAVDKNSIRITTTNAQNASAA